MMRCALTDVMWVKPQGAVVLPSGHSYEMVTVTNGRIMSISGRH